MQEACYCGRTGEVEDRKPVTDDKGAEALECRRCGHLEHLWWLPVEARGPVLREAKRRDHGRRRVAA